MELAQVRLLVDDFAGAFRFYRDPAGHLVELFEQIPQGDS
jgi:hypothetical protein